MRWPYTRKRNRRKTTDKTERCKKEPAIPAGTQGKGVLSRQNLPLDSSSEGRLNGLDKMGQKVEEKSASFTCTGKIFGQIISSKKTLKSSKITYRNRKILYYGFR